MQSFKFRLFVFIFILVFFFSHQCYGYIIKNISIVLTLKLMNNIVFVLYIIKLQIICDGDHQLKVCMLVVNQGSVIRGDPKDSFSKYAQNK